jgi:two-component system, chemotaxis family, protein-glutamate methylesterase/glutaminase
MLVKEGGVLVTKGARENRSRPAIDPTFRSAAVAYGPGVIGIILTGGLDDGTAGLMAVKACGSIGIVQDPKTALYPDMPQSALDNVKVDFCMPVKEIGDLLAELVSKSMPRRGRAVPKEIRLEAEIAERVLSDVSVANHLGNQVPSIVRTAVVYFGRLPNPRNIGTACHTGHSFTAASLEGIQVEKIEETLWICLRMLEERKNLLNMIAARATQRGFSKVASLQKDRARETKVHIERIRDILQTSTKAMGAGLHPRH